MVAKIFFIIEGDEENGYKCIYNRNRKTDLNITKIQRHF